MLTRLPQLLGDSLLLDGDEAVVGLMAKHFLDGRELPIFFYGQRYGLTLLEATLGALCFSVAGMSAASLKAAMLGLFVLGWMVFALCLRRVVRPVPAAIAALLFAVCPTWSEWSMMARGGYLTGFLLVHVGLLLFLGVYEKRERRSCQVIALGCGGGRAFAFRHPTRASRYPPRASDLDRELA